VLDAHASTTDGFLSSGTCVSPIQLKGPIWNKQPNSTLKTYVAGSFPFKNELNFQRETKCYLQLPTLVFLFGVTYVF
jgi:hypothetical protein